MSEGIKALAKKVQAQGRDGDTILAHIMPHEAAMLKRMGGRGTVNPKTGLLEFGVDDGPEAGSTGSASGNSYGGSSPNPGDIAGGGFGSGNVGGGSPIGGGGGGDGGGDTSGNGGGSGNDGGSGFGITGPNIQDTPMTIGGGGGGLGGSNAGFNVSGPVAGAAPVTDTANPFNQMDMGGPSWTNSPDYTPTDLTPTMAMTPTAVLPTFKSNFNPMADFGVPTLVSDILNLMSANITAATPGSALKGTEPPPTAPERFNVTPSIVTTPTFTPDELATTPKYSPLGNYEFDPAFAGATIPTIAPSEMAPVDVGSILEDTFRTITTPGLRSEAATGDSSYVTEVPELTTTLPKPTFSEGWLREYYTNNPIGQAVKSVVEGVSDINVGGWLNTLNLSGTPSSGPPGLRSEAATGDSSYTPTQTVSVPSYVAPDGSGRLVSRPEIDLYNEMQNARFEDQYGTTPTPQAPVYEMPRGEAAAAVNESGIASLPQAPAPVQAVTPQTELPSLEGLPPGLLTTFNMQNAVQQYREQLNNITVPSGVPFVGNVVAGPYVNDPTQTSTYQTDEQIAQKIIDNLPMAGLTIGPNGDIVKADAEGLPTGEIPSQQQIDAVMKMASKPYTVPESKMPEGSTGSMTLDPREFVNQVPAPLPPENPFTASTAAVTQEDPFAAYRGIDTSYLYSPGISSIPQTSVSMPEANVALSTNQEPSYVPVDQIPGYEPPVTQAPPVSPIPTQPTISIQQVEQNPELTSDYLDEQFELLFGRTTTGTGSDKDSYFKEDTKQDGDRSSKDQPDANQEQAPAAPPKPTTGMILTPKPYIPTYLVETTSPAY